MMEAQHPEVVAFFNRSFLKAEILYKESVKLFTQGMYKEALLSVNHAMHITTEDVKLLIMQSKIYRMLGELQPAYDSMLRAKAIFVKAFEGTDYPMELPSDIVLQINLILNDMAIDYAAKGNYEKAILLLNKIIKTEKTLTRGGLVKINHKYYVNRGDCHRALNSLADAVCDYNTALEIKRDDWEIRTRLSLTHYLIATVYFNQSQYLETQAELDKAINFNPKVSEYFALRGRTHYFQSNFSQAYADFKRALSLNSDNNEVREWLAQFDDEERGPSRGPKEGSLGAQGGHNGHGGGDSPRKARAKKRIDFTKVSQTVQVATVRKLEVTADDFVEMMLLPKKAAKLPVLRMLTKEDESKPKKKSIRSATADAHGQGEKGSALPTLRLDSPFAHDESRLQGAYAAAHAVGKKNQQLQELYNTRAQGVARGPLWDLVETAKALAYAKSHPKHRNDGEVKVRKSSSAKAKTAGGNNGASKRPA